MVAVISGNSLGLLNSSLNVLGTNQGVSGVAASGRNGEGVFVNAATGNLIIQRHDDMMIGRGTDIDTVRTYNSQGGYDRPNWNIGFYRQLTGLSTSTPNTGTNTKASTITRIDADGAELLYTYDSTRQAYINKDGSGSYDSLSYNATSKQWTWTDGDSRVTETFDWQNGSGKLLNQTDTDGNVTSFSYSAGRLSQAKTANGETTNFEYTNGNLSAISTLGSDAVSKTRVRYEYDGYSRLTRVTVDLTPQDNSISDNNTYVTEYSYYNNFLSVNPRISEIRQSDGTRLSFGYDTNYRVASIVDALGNRTDFTYDSVNRKTTVNDPLGLITQYSYDAKGQLLNVVEPAVNGVSQSKQFSYNANGDVTQITDGEGNRLVMEYDANGNPITQRDEAGNTLKRTYNANNQILSETVFLVPDPDGAGSAQATLPQTTRYVYDTAGKSHLRFMISPEGRVTEYRYDAFGQRLSQIEYTASQYTAAGVLESNLNTWVASNNKMQTQRTDWTYDFRGAVATSTTYSSVDSAGNGSRDGNQAVTTYVYNAAGELLKTIAPRSAQEVTTYTYDGLGRVLTSSNALRQVTTYQYDDAGGKTTQTQANGLLTIRSYDKAGRLVSESQSDAAARSQNLGSTNNYYDANGRLRMTQDPTGVRQWLFYDNAGRKIGEVDGNGGLTEYLYNKNNQLTRTIRHAVTGLINGLTVDAQGRPTESALALSLNTVRPASNAQDQQTWFAYDKAGRLAKTVDGTGAVTETQYDGAGRVSKVIQYATRLTSSVLAALGNTPSSVSIATTASAADDRVARQLYDNDGLLRAKIDGEGFLTEINYNAAGQVWQSISYANALSATVLAGINAGTVITTSSMASLRPTTTTSDIREYTWYDARGTVIAKLNGEGYFSEMRYDANGNQIQAKTYAKAVVAANINAIVATTTVAQIRPIANATLDQSSSTTYDELGRVTLAVNQDGTKTQYVYDTAGNLIRKTQALGTDEARTQTLRYDVQGRLTRELSAQGGAELAALSWPTNEQIEQIWNQFGTSYQYDLAGRRISSTDPLGQQTLYFYNLDGDLVYTINPAGEVQGRSYNVLEQLTARTSFGTRLSLDDLNQLPKGGLISQAVSSAMAQLANSSVDSTRRFGYTLGDKLASSMDELGNLTSFTYNAFGQQISEVKPLTGILTVNGTLTNGTVSNTQEYDRRGLQISQTEDSTGIKAKNTVQYDAFGRAISRIDANGNQSKVSYDRLGRTVQIKDGTQAATSTTYDAFDRITSMTDALGKTTSYSYNSSTRSVTITTPENVVVTTSYNRHGQMQAVKDGNGKITSFSYDANGALLKTTSELNQTSSRYDNAQRLIESVDANGIVTTLSYDAANRVLERHVDPNGLNYKTVYEYDAKGQVLSVTNANGISTINQYDLKGQLIQQTIDPNGLNLVSKMNYDAQSHVLSVIDANNVLTQYAYDKLGRRVEERVDPTGLNLQTRFTYDANGNLSSKLDPKQGLTRYVYDAENRQIFSISATGSVQETRYDANGRVIQQIGYANALNLTGLVNPTSATEVKARLVLDASRDVAQRQVYDRDGRLAYRISGVGAVTQMRYDGNGNLLSKTVFANLLASPDSLPSSVQADVLRDQTVTYVYDALNRVSYSVDGVGAVKQFSYDGNGNLLSSTSYANLVSDRNAPANVVPDAQDQTITNEYDAANRLVNTLDGLQQATRFEYDAVGNLVSKIVHGDDFTGLNQVARFEYDAANRQITSIDALGTVTHQDYDGNGNLTASTTYANALGDVNRVTRYEYDADNRLRFAADPTGAVKRYTYDANGNLSSVTAFAKAIATDAAPSSVQSTIGLDQTQKFSYDADNRLRYAADAVGAVKQYQYDGNNHVVKTIAHATKLVGNAAPETVLTSEQDQVTRDYFNAANQHSYHVDGVGAVTQNFYDARGNLIRQTVYDKPVIGDVVPTSVNLGSGHTTRTVYDAADQAIYRVNGVGAVTRQQFDAFGNVTVSTTYATAIGVNDAPQQVGINDLLDRSTRHFYDALNREIYQVNGVGAVSQNRYDVFGNVIARTVFANMIGANDLPQSLASDAAGQTTRFSYDAAGRMTYAVNPMGRVTQQVYDTYGNVRVQTTYASLIGTQDSPDSVPPSAQDRVLRFEVDAANRITASVDAMGGVTRVGYDTFGNAVIKTVYAKPITDQESAADVTEDVALDHTTRAVFDAANRVSYSVDTLGGVSKMTYDAFGNLTAKTVYAKPLANPADLPSNVPTDKLLDRSTSFVFDAANQMTYAVNEVGSVSNMRYDTSGNLISKTLYAAKINVGEPAQSVTINSKLDHTERFFFDADDKMIYSVNGVGAVTHLSYDTMGNLIRQSVLANPIGVDGDPALVAPSANDRTTRALYDAANQLSYTADGVGAVVQYARDAFGNIVAKTNFASKLENASSSEQSLDTVPRDEQQDHTTRSVYDLNNQVTYAINGVGAVSQYERDVFGNITRSTDFANTLSIEQMRNFTPESIVPDELNDQVTRFVFDAKDRQNYAVSSSGVVTQNTYDIFGNLLSKKQYANTIDKTVAAQDVIPNDDKDRTVRLRYDLANRLRYSANELGAVKEYRYDGFGNVNQSIAYFNTITALDEPSTVKASSLGLDQQSSTRYDAANRIKFTVDALGVMTQYSYDTSNNLIETTKYSQPIGINEEPVARQTVATDQTVRAEFNAANQQVYTINAVGAVTQYRYDSSGNRVSSTAYATLLEAQETTGDIKPSPQDQTRYTLFDGANRRQFAVDGTGGVSQFSYDAFGNVVASTDYVTRLNATQLASISALPHGNSLLNTLVRNEKDQTERAQFDAANRKIYSADGTGAVSKFDYDANDNLIGKTVFANRLSDGQASLSSVSGNASLDRVSSFTFDIANRMSSAIDAMGVLSQYTYDSFGNLTAQTMFAKRLTAGQTAADVKVDAKQDRTTRNTYDIANRKIYTADSMNVVTKNTYDVFGNLTEQTLYATPLADGKELPMVTINTDLDQTSRAVFDVANRLVFTVNSMGAVTKLSYDSFGNATEKTAYAKTIDAKALPSSVKGDSSVDHTSSSIYDAQNRLSYAKDNAGTVTRFEYDAFGNLSKKTTFANTLALGLVASSVQADPLRDQITRAEFDAANRIVYSADAVGAVTQCEYDGAGNMLRKTAYANQIADTDLPSMVTANAETDRVTSYEYDAAGRQIKTFMPKVGVYQTESKQALLDNGRTQTAARVDSTQVLYTEAIYDSFGNIVANRDAAGKLRYQGYNAQDRVIWSVDAEGYVSDYQRDSFGNATSNTRFAAQISASVRDAWASAIADGQVEQAKQLGEQELTALRNANSPQNRSILTDYDALGRAIRITQPEVDVFDGADNTRVSQRNPVSQFIYNGLGQLVQEQELQTNNSWANTFHYYDLQGREKASVNPAGYLTLKEYDTFGNVTKQTEFANASTSFSQASYTLPLADANDRVLSYRYDFNNRKISDTHHLVEYSTQGDGSSARKDVSNQYAYDAFGNLIQITGANNAAVRTYFDRANRTSAVVGAGHNIDGSADKFYSLTEFMRNAFGDVSSSTEFASGANNANDFSYSRTENTSNDRTTRMRYDNWGRTVEITDAAGKQHFQSYNAAGQLAKQWTGVTGNDGITRTSFTVQQYDALGRNTGSLSAASDRNSVVETRVGFNAFGEMTSRGIVGKGDEAAETFEYDNGGRLWRSNAGDGVRKVMLHDLQGRQTAQISSATQDLSTVTTAAQALLMADTRRSQAQYDVLGNQIQERAFNAQVINKTYDRWGNLLSQSDIRNTTWLTRYTYNANNQVLSTAQTDDDGRAIVTSIFYDISGNQIAVRDARGNINRKTYDDAGNLLSEIHADAIGERGIVSHAYNAFGNEVKRTDAMGNVTQFAYNQLGLMKEMKRAQTAYGSLADLNARTNFEQTTSMQYDELGQKIAVIHHDGSSVKYSYDMRGNIIEQNELGVISKTVFDARDRKLSELDANGKTTTYVNDYFGRVLEKQVTVAEIKNGDKLVLAASSNRSTFTYDLAGQLSREVSDGGLEVVYRYDSSGQLVKRIDRMEGGATNGLYRTTEYGYDAASHRTLEKTSIGHKDSIDSEVSSDSKDYQDQSLSYDKLGRMSSVTSFGRTLSYSYDQVGNIVSQEENIGGSDMRKSYFAYDNMNRQILVDAKNNSNILDKTNFDASRGMRVSYDFNGNRTMEETGVDLASKNEYGYDAQGHLTTTTKDGKLDNERVYDQLGRAVFVKKLSYKDGNTNTTYDFKNTYDANGRLSHQVLQDAADGKITNVSNVYDKAGNLVESWRNKQDNPNIQYLYVYQLFGDALKQNTVTAFRSDNGGNPGVTESKYDFSGNLVKLHDRQKSENDREFINDAGGFVLLKSQNLSKATPDQLHNLVANGQVLGSYGSDLDAENPDTSSNYATKTGDTLQSIAASKTGESWKELLKLDLMVWVNEDIDPDEEKVNMQDVAYRIDNTVKVKVEERQNMRLVEGQNIIIHAQNMSDKMRNFIDYQKIDQAHPGADTMAYRVMVGDSLRGIAQKIYGDADLWYVLADANGLFSDSDLRAGQVLNVPARVSGVHNNATSFKPYEPGAIIGDTSPYIPPPESGGNRCAVIGIIIAAVVAAVVITVLTAGAGAAIAGPGLSVAATVAVGVASGAVGGALGSAASQGILIAGGLQSSLSWKEVGIGALTGAISGGAMAWAGAAGTGASTGARAGANGAQIAANGAANAVRAASLSTRIGAVALRSAGYAALSVTNDAIGQGIRIASDSSVKFSWQSMVAAGVSGAMSGAMSKVGNTAMTELFAGIAGDIGGSALGNVIVNNGGFDPTQFAIDATANVIGGGIGGLAAKAGRNLGRNRNGGAAEDALQNGELQPLINAGRNRRASSVDDADDGNVLQGLLAGGERRLSAGSDLDQRGDLPDLGMPRGRRASSVDDLQQAIELQDIRPMPTAARLNRANADRQHEADVQRFQAIRAARQRGAIARYDLRDVSEGSATLAHLKTPYVGKSMRVKDEIENGVRARFLTPTDDADAGLAGPKKRQISAEQVAAYRDISARAIDVEKQVRNTDFVFYHAQDPRMRVAQDVYKRAYSAFHGVGVPENFHFLRFPTPGNDEFSRHRNVRSYFLEDMNAHGMIDDNINPTKTHLTSVNPALHGGLGHAGEETFHYFQIGQGQTELPVANIMKGFLEGFGVNGDGAAELYQRAAALNATKEGSLFQILVPKDMVDDVAYMAHPHGLPHDDQLFDDLHTMGEIRYPRRVAVVPDPLAVVAPPLRRGVGTEANSGLPPREKMNDEVTRNLLNMRTAWKPADAPVGPPLTRQQEFFLNRTKDLSDRTVQRFVEGRYKPSEHLRDFIEHPSLLQHPEGHVQALRMRTNPDHFGGQGVRSEHELMRIQNRSTFMQARLHFSEATTLNPTSGVRMNRYTTMEGENLRQYNQLLDDYVAGLFAARRD